MLRKVVQLSFLLIGGTLGVLFLPQLFDLFSFSSNPLINNPYVAAIVGGLLFFLLNLFLTTPVVNFIKWMEERLLGAPIFDLLFGTVGLIIGLSVAFLVSFWLGSIEIPVISSVLPTVLFLILGYLGFQVGFKQREEIIHAMQSIRTHSPKKKDAEEPQVRKTRDTMYKILDTSVIIDGRIADISATGFLEGILVVPQFILTELQHIADSSDTLKRTKGRRGLDVLKALQTDGGPGILITDVDFADVAEVDLKLVHLAKDMGGLVVTNDFNLNKVAALHGVAVLNINDLANAVKPVVIPGEEMHVVVIKDGKEQNQGVAYLDDGTMIVVEDGKTHIGNAIDVIVTSVLQTSAGRMIFAKPKHGRAVRAN
ncbi:PIN/TRAM domain-containing protein [Sporosarcina pasteurii]|uniref:Uncharacterized PIN and TRAM-domain containing protein TTHA0540 n=1 Tax=Sporosarcina pasteurii TaxID=1474 RepID=A0A380CKW1_SPOPA|nr:PIN/TRAM domain-containing protein [Sporosarcina pasteurii]MDS9471977.1 PIN/TRAM domain-containing protein [Sporosarcina pasteurii]QBQ06707.1 PIN/TRAM domain-containing protein [Sporosarcina pasteurii]SUJ21613.1 Uncharacterized PIN and TRAM-domain containing protein TTHA0540 precursor [Sporosarcina pasteurii]